MPVIKTLCPQEKQKCIAGAKRAQQGFKQMCAFPFEDKYFEYPNWVRSLSSPATNVLFVVSYYLKKKS